MLKAQVVGIICVLALRISANIHFFGSGDVAECVLDQNL